jgi:hypothetical protein
MLRLNNISAPNLTIPSSTNPSNMSEAANLLAMVNDNTDAVSESSRDSEDSRDLLTGDLHTGNFGDSIYVKTNNTLRIGFQNVGGFPTQTGKIKEDNIRLGVQ